MQDLNTPLTRKFGKPMKADNKPFDAQKVWEHLPVWGSIKLDGIRMIVHDGVGYSNSLKPLPNKDLQRKVFKSRRKLQGFDGEIIIGDPAADNCYSKTFTAVMTEEGEFDHQFYAFDIWSHSGSYRERHTYMQFIGGTLDSVDQSLAAWFHVLEQEQLSNMVDVYAYAELNFNRGHEGSILRDPKTLYKNGRATATQGQLYKMKKWVDTECKITGFEELMHNDNAPTLNEMGYTHRSAHKDNKRPGDTLGAIWGEGKFDDGRPYRVKIGTFKGFTKTELKAIWDERERHLGRLFKFKYMDIGIKDAPRHPVGLGFRDPMDL